MFFKVIATDLVDTLPAALLWLKQRALSKGGSGNED